MPSKTKYQQHDKAVYIRKSRIGWIIGNFSRKDGKIRLTSRKGLCTQVYHLLFRRCCVCCSHFFFLGGLKFFDFCVYLVSVKKVISYSWGIISLQPKTVGRRKMSQYTEGEGARLKSFLKGSY